MRNLTNLKRLPTIREAYCLSFIKVKSASNRDCGLEHGVSTMASSWFMTNIPQVEASKHWNVNSLLNMYIEHHCCTYHINNFRRKVCSVKSHFCLKRIGKFNVIGILWALVWSESGSFIKITMFVCPMFSSISKKALFWWFIAKV